MLWLENGNVRIEDVGSKGIEVLIRFEVWSWEWVVGVKGGIWS